MESRKRILLLLMIAFWVGVMNRGVQAAHVCGDVCAGASCDAECWLTEFDYDNEYPSTTCGEQNYSCCGDGVCDTSIEYCGSCTADCGDSPTCATECTWDYQCASGQKCNPSHECVDPTPNNSNSGTSCSNKNSCYDGNACTAGDCSVSSKEECDGNAICYNTPQCQGWFGSDTYCNPGNDHCMYVTGPGCPG